MIAAEESGCRLGILKAKYVRRASGCGVTDATQWAGYEQREGVERFLAEHPALRPLVREAGDKLREYFGEATELAVERFVDPESSSAPVELFLRVKTPLDVEEARERLGRFEEEWWLDNLQRGDYLLNVALEFV
jgi:hypothetical protein